MADTKDFYFKLFAREYLTSGEIREIHLEAQGILPRLWSVCCLEGSMPSDLEDLSIAAGVKHSHLRTHMPSLMRFFCAGDDGRLYSARMEREREHRQKVSAGASKAAKAMHAKRMATKAQPGADDSAHANAHANAHAAIVHSSKPQPKDQKTTPAPRKRGTAKVAESLDEILGGSKGTPTYEAYWKLVGTMGGQAKNSAPKTTAKLYVAAIAAGISPEQIQAKAEALRRTVDDPRYLKQLQVWLEGQGYLTPDSATTPTPNPHIPGAPNGSRSPQHRAGVDAAYIQTLAERPAQHIESAADDPELRSLFEAGANT